MDDWSSLARGNTFGNMNLMSTVNNNLHHDNHHFGHNNNNNNGLPPGQSRFAHAVEINQELNEETTFQLELQQETFDQRTGQAVSFATANNWIVIGTTKNNLIRWFIEAENDEDEKNIIPISDKQDERIYELFLSPNGKHILISMTNGVLYYIPTNHRVTKPIQIQKFKDILQSVSWYQYDNDIVTNHASNTTHNPIQRVLLGTSTGCLYELCLEDTHERSLKKLFELSSINSLSSSHHHHHGGGATSSLLSPINNSSMNPLSSAISGIRIIRAGVDEKYKKLNSMFPGQVVLKDNPSHATRWYLIFVTSSHKYTLYGGPTMEALLQNVINNPSLIKSIELPGGLLTSNQLAAYTPQCGNHNNNDDIYLSTNVYAEHLSQSLVPPKSYGWLTTAGLYFGEIDPLATTTISVMNSNALTMLDALSPTERLIDFPKIQDTDTTAHRLSTGEGLGTRPIYLQPISHIVTAYHIIFLYRQHLSIVNLVSGMVIMSCPLPKNNFGVTKKLCYDEVQNTLWLLTDVSIYEIIVTNEDKDIWRIYLQQGDYERAYIHSNTPYQERLISTYHAEYLFTQGQYELAAKQYIRSFKTFEGICMRYLIEYQQFSSSSLITNSNPTTSSSGNGNNNNNAANSVANALLSSVNSNGINEGNDVLDSAAMPTSLFSSSLSTLFGPQGYFTASNNNNGSNNIPLPVNPNAPAGSNADLTYQAALKAALLHQQQYANNGNSNANNIEISSLSLLLHTQPGLLTKFNNNNNNQTISKKKLSKTNDNNTDSTLITDDNNGNNNNNNTSSSIIYYQKVFHLLEKKWAIYNGLKTYLKLMLSKINQTDKTKLTTLSSWVVELYINTLVSLQTSFVTLDSNNTNNKQSLTYGKTNNTTTTNTIKDNNNNNNNALLTNELQQLEQQRIELYLNESTELKTFLEDYLDCLHPRTTYALLSSAGRAQECLFYAKLNNDYANVLDIYIREKLYYDAILYLKTLRKKIKQDTTNDKTKTKQNSTTTTTNSTTLEIMSYQFVIDSDLIYRIIPTLIQHHSTEMVDLLIETTGLQPTQVLTAMVRSGLQIEMTNTPIQPTADGQFQDLLPKATTTTTTQNNTNGQQIQKVNQFLTEKNHLDLLQNKLSSIGINTNINNKALIQQQQTVATIPIAQTQIVNKKIDISVFADPSNIKNVSVVGSNGGNKTGLNNNNNTYLYDVSRYLSILIQTNTAPIAGHNLYIAILIQLYDAQRLYAYLIAHKHTTYPNRVFALRLALPHVEIFYSAVIELCLQLQRHTLAIRFALRYDVNTAKRILKNLSTTSSTTATAATSTNNRIGDDNNMSTDSNGNGNTTNANIELSLWQEYIQLLLANNYTISQIIQDIRSWNNNTNTTTSSSNNNTHKMINGINHNNTALLKILPCLPQQTITIGEIRDNVVQQLLDFNMQLTSLNNNMSLLHQTNYNLKASLQLLQQSIITISVSQRCDVCSQPVLLSPFIYFRCGHVFHIKCSINLVQQFFIALQQSQQFDLLNGSSMSPLLLSDNNTSSTQQRALTKKQLIYLQMLANLYDDLTTTTSFANSTLNELDGTTDDAQDLTMITLLRNKVINNTLTIEEELFFYEEYAQQSCNLCGDLMIDSIGLSVTSGPSSGGHNHSADQYDQQDWSL